LPFCGWLIASGEWRRKLAEAICTGIDNFRTLSETKKRPMVIADYRRQKTEFAAREKQSPLNPSAPPTLSLQISKPTADAAFPTLQPSAAASPSSPEQSPSPSPVGTAPAEP
jgi:hypothetical protein